MHLCAGVSLFCIGCPSILVPLIYLVQVGQEGQDSLRQIVILCNYGAIRAVISHRVKLNIIIMKVSISQQERLLLAAIILSGLCANSCHAYSHFFHVKTSVCLLNKLLANIDSP